MHAGGTPRLQALEHRPPSEVWVQLPEISRWQWHPFTVAGGEGSLLTLHIKRYGAFTKVHTQPLCALPRQNCTCCMGGVLLGSPLLAAARSTCRHAYAQPLM